MTGWVEEILRRYGQTVTLVRGEDRVQAKAFLQPLRERDEAVPETADIGWLDGRRWLYLGREALETGDRVLWKGEGFRVRSGRAHYVGNTLCHWRAVLERARETG